MGAAARAPRSPRGAGKISATRQIVASMGRRGSRKPRSRVLRLAGPPMCGRDLQWGCVVPREPRRDDTKAQRGWQRATPHLHWGRGSRAAESLDIRKPFINPVSRFEWGRGSRAAES